MIGGISTKQARALRAVTALEDKYIFSLTAKEAHEILAQYNAKAAK
jgi:hypothetical protein